MPVNRKVELLKEQDVFHQAIFTVREARLRHELRNGTMSDEIVRLNLDRGDSVAALVHNVESDEIVLTLQFRYPTYQKGEGPGWLLELPAGVVRRGEDPAGTLMRELEEEIGYRARNIVPITSFYLSPGGSSERIWLYYVEVDASSRVSDGGGVADEGEDIEVVYMPVTEALTAVEEQQLPDAKTIIALQWLAARRLLAASGG